MEIDITRPVMPIATGIMESQEMELSLEPLEGWEPC